MTKKTLTQTTINQSWSWTSQSRSDFGWRQQFDLKTLFSSRYSREVFYFQTFNFIYYDSLLLSIQLYLANLKSNPTKYKTNF